MIIYQATKAQFLDDSFKRDIQEVISVSHLKKTGHTVGAAEIRAWKESLLCMAKVLHDDEIPANSGVAIEYTIPLTRKRIDFILTGRGSNDSRNVIVVELKQWSEAKRTEKDAVVVTRLSGGECEVSHPSYQAWSYVTLLEGFNEAVYDGGLKLQPCAYLHNYAKDDVLDHDFYAHYIAKAPLFLKGEAERDKLRSFIKQYVKLGDNSDLIYKIENGRIRPSKMLVDRLAGMLKGNQEFVLIDDQKVVYENALAVARKAADDEKRVVVIEGGPGTGKSVLAIHLLVALSKLGLVCRYVSKNAAPRSVYESRLTGVLRKTEISNLFSGSGAFTESECNSFDVLIVDEAHRLNEKSGLYANLGSNQIKEVMSAAKCAVLFVDDDQQVTLKDIGSKAEIRKWAAAASASVTSLELASQFRCNGSDGYLAWLDNTLGVRPTANETLDTAEFDFRVLDSPAEMHELIAQKNKVSNKARVVAGYCWNWVSKKNPDDYDINIPEWDYKKRWNLSSDGSLWIIAPSSVDQVGCIHTSQGLEVDYVGVIIGPDLVARDGEVVCRPEKRARTDKSMSGYKKLAQADPIGARKRADQLIKNTYRTLMTRGMKGCYVYCTDPETAAFIKSRLKASSMGLDASSNIAPFRRLRASEVVRYVNSLPLVDLKLAAGLFSDQQVFEPLDAEWVEVPKVKPKEGLFVAQVVGESMNRRIPNGAWCVFRFNPTGSKNGRVVVAQHKQISDADVGGSYTVKVYESEKSRDDDGAWHHTRITLRPDSDVAGFKPIVFEASDLEGLDIVAELVTVLG
jgi:uncharacterized protein